MRGRALPVAVAALSVALTATPCTAGGMRDLADAWLIPADGVDALLGCSDASPWRLAVAQGRLFDLADLPQLGLAVGRRWRRIACGLRWERLGRTPYREDRWRLTLLVGDRWRLGAAVGADQLRLAGDAATGAVAADLRLQGRVGSDLWLDLWWPLTVSPSWHGRLGLRRWWRLAGSGDGWSWALVADRRGDGTPSLQGEVLVRVVPGVGLGLRLEPGSGTAGLCTAWRVGSVRLRSSHLVHPELGTSHRWGLELGGRP